MALNYDFYVEPVLSILYPLPEVKYILYPLFGYGIKEHWTEKTATGRSDLKESHPCKGNPCPYCAKGQIPSNGFIIVGLDEVRKSIGLKLPFSTGTSLWKVLQSKEMLVETAIVRHHNRTYSITYKDADATLASGFSLSNNDQNVLQKFAIDQTFALKIGGRRG